jgi:hypothetical protein
MDLVPTCHRRFQEWRELGIFDTLWWSRLLKIYDNKKGINWSWQSLDSISVKSPLGGRRQAIILLTEAN